MRNLNENAGAIARLRIAPASATVCEVEQHLDSLADNLVTFLPADAGDEPDPTGIVLLRGIVQTLRRRQTVFRVETRHHGLHPTIELFLQLF
jgi:hypothetical protein